MNDERETSALADTRVDELTEELREAHYELDRLRTENAVLRQLGDMVPEPPSNLDD